MDFSTIEKNLVSEIKLSAIQAKVYLLVTCYGRMSSKKIAEKLQIPISDADHIAKYLIEIGAFIDFSPTEFEAMHPRFTAVNMYRRLCEREGVEFKQNKIVDGIGVLLEKLYDDARTK